MIVTADSVKMDSRALATVEKLFWRQIEDGLHPGAALAVYRYGNSVLDLYGGIADTDTGRPVTQDTLFVLYSSTKAITASCMHLLWQQGKLMWDDPVAKHWPEFAQNGKGKITIRHVLTHQGGFPDTPKELTWDKWRDWDAVVKAMEGITPTHEPEAVIAYHRANYGWVIAELVRRIDGRPFSQFLREEITGPLGMNDTYVGLPPSEEGRVSRIHPMKDSGNPEVAATANRPEVHQAVHPAGGGIATARDLARFYAMMACGGTLDGVRVLNPETVAGATAFQLEGTDLTFGTYVYRALGLWLGDPRMGASKTVATHTFGHGGIGTSVGWADPDIGLAVGFIANGFQANPTHLPRLTIISQAIRDACF